MPDGLELRRHPALVELLPRRARAKQALRRVLDERGLVEVDVPPLLPYAGQEPHLQPPRVELAGLSPLWLQTSPELTLKRLLCGGASSIYSLGWAFRGGREELSALHQPQFLMLEWYRPGADVRDLADDVEALLRACSEALGTATMGEALFLSVGEALGDFAGVPIEPLLDGDGSAFARAARQAGISGCRDDDDMDVLFGRVLVERVEPALRERGGLVFLHGYPPCGAALAAPHRDDPRLFRRVEAYLDGVELANGWVELADAAELERRWRFEASCREGPGAPFDRELLRELAVAPWPPTVGMALGVDRLIMALCGAASLHEVLPLHLDFEARGEV